MKKIILAIAATFMIATAANAQDDKNCKEQPQKLDKTEMIQKRTDKMVKEFGLDKAQAKKLLTLNTAYSDKIGGRMMGGPGGKPGFGRGPQGGNGQFKSDSATARKRPEMTEEQRAEMKKQRAEKEANRTAYETELQKIMTTSQFNEYQSAQAKNKQGHGSGMDKDNGRKTTQE